MAKSPNVPHTQNVLLAERKITPLKDAGKGLEHIYVPKGQDPKIKPMKTPAMKSCLKNQLTPKLHLRANQTHEIRTQKTNFATTPNM